MSLKKQGWALRRGSSRGHLLNENQKKYLINLFLLGEQTERKTDPNKVSKSIRKVHNADGSLKVFFWAYILNKKHRTRRLLNIFTSCLWIFWLLSSSYQQRMTWIFTFSSQWIPGISTDYKLLFLFINTRFKPQDGNINELVSRQSKSLIRCIKK